MFNNARLVIGAALGIIIAVFIWSMVFSDKAEKAPAASGSEDALMQLVPDESFLKKKGE